MPVPFGVSVGDFIAVIGAFIKVCEALRDSGGAVSEYRQTVSQLQQMQAIIAQVETLKISSASSTSNDIASIVNALCGQGSACRSLLNQFVERVKRYDPALGSQTPQGFHRHMWTKGKWALHFSKELDNLRKVISAQMEAINLQFQLLLAALSETAIQDQAAQQLLLTDYISSQQKIASTQISALQGISSQLSESKNTQYTYHKNQKSQIEDSFADMRTHVKDILDQCRNPDQDVVSTLQDLRSEIISQRNLLKSLVRDASGHVLPEFPEQSTSFRAQRTNALIRGQPTATQQSAQTATGMFTAFTLPFVRGLKEIAKATADAMSRDPGRRNELNQLMKVIGDFAALLKAYIAALTPILLHTYMYLKVLVPKMKLLMNSVSVRSPLQLNIIFEDVLGRQHGLPYHYFRHWDTFKTMLENEFRGCPGEEKVLRGDYRLMNARRYYSVLSPEDWDESVQPGTKVVMSVLMAQLRKARELCQRDGCQGTQESKGRTRTVCNTCGLELHVSNQTAKVVKLPDDANEKRKAVLLQQQRILSIRQKKKLAEQTLHEELKKLPAPPHQQIDEDISLFRRIHWEVFRKPVLAHSNSYTDIRVANDIALWLHDREALAEATNGLEPSEFFERMGLTMDELESMPPVIAVHPQWRYLTVKKFVPENGYIGEVNGLIGSRADYFLNPFNRWDLLQHPGPFLFSPPQLPIDNDTRHEGTVLGNARRSCKPNLGMRIMPRTIEIGYHFLFIATEDIYPDNELTIGWEFPTKIHRLMQSVRTNGFTLLQKKILDQWVSSVLFNFGCACQNSEDKPCLLALVLKTALGEEIGDPSLAEGVCYQSGKFSTPE